MSPDTLTGIYVIVISLTAFYVSKRIKYEKSKQED